MTAEPADNQDRADLALVGGTVIDGTGAPGRRADLAVCAGRISEIAEPGALNAVAVQTLDVSDRVVAPGFIDVHTHDDAAVLNTPLMLPKISQGVTTVVVGNCGISLSPGAPLNPPPMNLLAGVEDFKYPTMAAYADAVDASGPAVNVAALVGHGTLRVNAMDDLRRTATPAEIDVMRERVAEGLDAGAIGMSSGLWYHISNGADADEVVALLEVVADKGGVYTTHMRNEADQVVESLKESFATALRAAVPVIISHHKCGGPKNWGRSRETLPMFDAARRHQPVGLDAYPYAAGSTILEGHIINPEVRTVVTWSAAHPQMSGRNLSDIADEWGCSQYEAVDRLKPAGAIYFNIDEQDMRRIVAYPPTMIGSDGLPNDRHPHPRLWGTFPRVLGRFSRDEGLMPLEQAVHKMTGLSAANFGLADRGEIKTGAHADLVVFDPDTIIDEATFEAPDRIASGIDYVIVSGGISWRDGAPTGHRSGRFIRRAA